MRFTARESFRHGAITYEAGNTYTAEVQGLTDAEVLAIYGAGWADVEGMDPAPERQVRGSVVRPDSASVGHVAEEPR